MPKRIISSLPCPCYAGSNYGVCCAPWHLGVPAPNAPALMRSRYSAYALGLIDYIIATTCARGPAYRIDTLQWRKELAYFSRITQFQGLDVVSVEPGTDVAHVTFRANLVQRRHAITMVERSRFRNTHGVWCYFSGVSPDEAN